MKWEQGRQGTGYLKKRIFECNFRLLDLVVDCYILKYPTGSRIPPHTDDLGLWKHWRLNITLRNAKKGGKFGYWRPDTRLPRVRVLPRTVLFRPDVVEHWVSRVEDGERYVLSIGASCPFKT